MKHDLFKQLCGNPLSVQIFASYCKSKIVQSDENALLTFYRIIKDELTSLTEDEAEIEVKDKINANKISIKLSVEAAMKLLKSMTSDETFNIYYELLFLVSCLPDGISKEHITSIWPNIDLKEIEKSIENLLSFSILKTGVQKVYLDSFVMNYV